MRLNKRGVALLQVLIISAVLAGLSAMILRAVMSRTSTARQTRRTVSAQLIIESCMAEIHNKYYHSEADKDDIVEGLNTCAFKTGTTPLREHTCMIYTGEATYSVKATFTTTKPDDDHGCTLKYTIENAVTTL